MIELMWEGGENEFALRIRELRALQEKLDSGPEEVLNRLRLGTWKVDDIIEVLRLGLTGAGMDTKDAKLMVMNAIDQSPIVNFKLTALYVMAHSLMGVEDDPVGEPEGVEDAPENGGSASSTEPEPQ